MDKVKAYERSAGGDKALKKLAMFSICVYIVVSTVFDAVKSDLSRLSSVAIYFCLACCAVYIFSRGTFKLRQVEIWLLIFGATLGVSLLYTPTSEDVVNMYFYRFCTSAILVMLISNTLCDRKDFETMVDIYIFAGVCISLYMYYTYGITNLAEATERLDNQLGNQNGTGMSCAFSVIFATYRLITRKGKGALFYIASIVICTPAMMFSGSRKALLIAFVAIIAFVFVYTRGRMSLSRLVLVVAVVAIMIAVINYVPAFSFIRDRVVSTFEAIQNNGDGVTNSDSNRIKYITDSLQKFLEKPILGNGFFYSHHIFGTYSHCNYTELLMNGGVIGFTAFYSIYALILRKAKKLFKASNDLTYPSFLIMVVIAFFVMDIGVVSYYDRYTLIMFTLCFCDENIQKPIASVQNNT